MPTPRTARRLSCPAYSHYLRSILRCSPHRHHPIEAIRLERIPFRFECKYRFRLRQIIEAKRAFPHSYCFDYHSSSVAVEAGLYNQPSFPPLTLDPPAQQLGDQLAPLTVSNAPLEYIREEQLHLGGYVDGDADRPASGRHCFFWSGHGGGLVNQDHLVSAAGEYRIDV